MQTKKLQENSSLFIVFKPPVKGRAAWHSTSAAPIDRELFLLNSRVKELLKKLLTFMLKAARVRLAIPRPVCRATARKSQTSVNNVVFISVYIKGTIMF